jgi:uncharacterized protein YkwD
MPQYSATSPIKQVRFASPAMIVRAWMHSHSHRVTLLNGRDEHVGVWMEPGTPWGTQSGDATYAADFGYTHG